MTPSIMAPPHNTTLKILSLTIKLPRREEVSYLKRYITQTETNQSHSMTSTLVTPTTQGCCPIMPPILRQTQDFTGTLRTYQY